MATSVNQTQWHSAPEPLPTVLRSPPTKSDNRVMSRLPISDGDTAPCSDWTNPNKEFTCRLFAWDFRPQSICSEPTKFPFLEFIVDCSQIQQCSSLDGSHAVWRHLLTPKSKVHWDLVYVSIVISRVRATAPKFVGREEENRKAGQNRTRAVAVGWKQIDQTGKLYRQRCCCAAQIVGASGQVSQCWLIQSFHPYILPYLPDHPPYVR